MTTKSRNIILISLLTFMTLVIALSIIFADQIQAQKSDYVYKMKMDAMKRQGKRTDLTSVPVAQKLGATTREIIGDESGESADQVRRYVRLTELTPELLDLVDEGSIAFRPAVELSYLKEDEQRDLLETIDSEEATPSLAQAIRLKKLSQEGKLDMDTIFHIMTEEKPNQVETVKFKSTELSKFFPERTPPEMIKPDNRGSDIR